MNAIELWFMGELMGHVYFDTYEQALDAMQYVNSLPTHTRALLLVA